MNIRRTGRVLGMVAAFVGSSCGRNHTNEVAADALVGAYRLVSLEEGDPDGTVHRADAAGSLVLTKEGRMAVQVMYRGPQSQTAAAPVQYAHGGYEASFGSFQVDEPGHSFTYHVDGALVRTLVGKDLKRIYRMSGNGVVIMPPTTDEHWRVSWERYSE